MRYFDVQLARGAYELRLENAILDAAACFPSVRAAAPEQRRAPRHASCIPTAPDAAKPRRATSNTDDRAAAQENAAMKRIEKTVEVDRPIRTVYNQWTQFEEFPRFMDGVKSVQQLDDTHVRWRAEIWGKDKEWDAEITEQVPDERISWKSVSGAPNVGTVRFEPLGADRTRVRLVMAYEPQGAIENAGDALGALSARVQSSVDNFKKYIEERGSEDGGWRGTVRDSQTDPSAPRH
jgi:uncharacterized membrane protein